MTARVATPATGRIVWVVSEYFDVDDPHHLRPPVYAIHRTVDGVETGETHPERGWIHDRNHADAKAALLTATDRGML